ncbi:hypothetical protein D9M73_266390 [compost metagenome]
MPKVCQSRVNCSKAARLSSRCGMKVFDSMLRLNISADCRCGLERMPLARPAGETGGSYQRPLVQHSA